MGDRLLYNIERGYLLEAESLISRGEFILFHHVVASIPEDGRSNGFLVYVLSKYKMNMKHLHELLVITLERRRYETFKFLCEMYGGAGGPLRTIIDRKTDKGLTLLQITVFRHLAWQTRMLIYLGANVHVIDYFGETLLHLLCSGSNWIKYQAHNHHLEIMILLIDSGVKRHIKNSIGLTAEDVALIYGHPEEARHLANY